MSRRTMLLAVTTGLTAAAAITACAAPASRHRTDAIAFIASNEMFDAYDVDFENIDCIEPDSTDEGATVTCRADGDDGQSYRFTFTVVGTNQLELTEIGFDGVVPSAEPDSSGPESTGATETAPEPAQDTAGSAPAAPTTASADSAVTVPAPPATTAAAVTTTTPTTTTTTPTTTAAPS